MKSPLIIEYPELQSPAQKTLSSVITTVAWTLWCYLWLPLLSLMLWGVGIQLMVVEVFLPDRTEDLRELLRLIGYVIFTAVAVLVWSQYNLRRYGRRNRRSRIPDVDKTTLARYYEISPKMLENLRNQRLLTLDYCNDHQPVLVDTETPISNDDLEPTDHT